MELTRPTVLARALRALLLLALVSLGVAWGLRVLVQAPQGSVAGFGSVQDLGRLANPAWIRWVVLGAVLLLGATLLLRRSLLDGPLAGAVAVGLLAMVFATALAPFGHFAVLACFSLFLAGAVGLLLPALRSREGPSDRGLALGLFVLVAGVSVIFPLHRHASFGSGSWDMGCMAHNFYRASRLLSTVSTVLGDVDFLGDHFMLGIYLYAPILWVFSSAKAVIVIQSLNLAAVAPALFLIARHRGVGRFPSAVIGLVTGFSFGLQSAHYFDSHEIAVGFGFLAFGLWALETGRLGWASVLLGIFATFKESLGAYVVGLGLLLAWRGLRAEPSAGRRRALGYAAGWIVGGAAWFVLVNRVLMPLFRAQGNAPEVHETFADFGPTVFEAVRGIALDPVRALGALFVPDEKLHSQLVTVMGTGALCLFAPEVLLAALPLLAERFLSSKSTMWEMGYHYAAPLCLYAGWAAALAFPGLERRGQALLERLGPGLGARAAQVLALYLLASLVLVNSVGYRHPANFHRWNEDYFSTPARQASNAKAIQLLRGLDREEKIAAQNRLLPHLADRPYAYRLGDYQKADYVLMTVGESAWPWDDGYPARLARELGQGQAFILVYAEGDTLIFARNGRGKMPRVSGPAALGLEIKTSTQSGIDQGSGPR